VRRPVRAGHVFLGAWVGATDARIVSAVTCRRDSHLSAHAQGPTRVGLSNLHHEEQPRIAVGRNDRRSCAAGAGRASARREHHDGLRSRAEPWRPRGSQPPGSAIAPPAGLCRNDAPDTRWLTCFATRRWVRDEATSRAVIGRFSWSADPATDRPLSRSSHPGDRQLSYRTSSA